RVRDGARMAERLRVRLVEVKGTEGQRLRRERGVVTARDRTPPMVLEHAALVHVFEAISFRTRLRPRAEIRLAHAAPRIARQHGPRSATWSSRWHLSASSSPIVPPRTGSTNARNLRISRSHCASKSVAGMPTFVSASYVRSPIRTRARVSGFAFGHA